MVDLLKFGGEPLELFSGTRNQDEVIAVTSE
jgi:hypothetical protein